MPIFNDNKYGTNTLKTDQQSQKNEQKSSKLRGLLKSIPIIGESLARTFTPKKIEIISNPIYNNMEEDKKSQDKSADHSSAIKDEEAVSSEVETSEDKIERVDNKKSRNL
jgi:hypothetical protein